MTPPDSVPSTERGSVPGSAAAQAISRRLLQLVGRELDYRDARHLRRHFCFSCGKRTVLEHVHTDAFVRRSRA